MRVVFGVGDYCLPVAELLASLGMATDAVADDRATVCPLPGVRVIRREEIPDGATVYVAIGDAMARRSIVAYLLGRGLSLGTAVHPGAYLAPSSRIGPGCIVHSGALLWSGVELGTGVLVSPHAQVAHHVFVEDFCLLSMSSTVGSHAHVGSGATIGIGATVSTGGIRIGRDALVGAGAVVVDDVPDGVTVVGNPARVLRT